jgi:hypothetical protein
MMKIEIIEIEIEPDWKKEKRKLKRMKPIEIGTS